jgi:hypothetical protein
VVCVITGTRVAVKRRSSLKVVQNLRRRFAVKRLPERDKTEVFVVVRLHFFVRLSCNFSGQLRETWRTRVRGLRVAGSVYSVNKFIKRQINLLITPRNRCEV